jgi:hypothetical protein
MAGGGLTPRPSIGTTMSDTISEDRLRNTRAWAFVRIGQLSGAEVIVGAIDELLAIRPQAARWQWLKANHLQTGPDSWIRTGDDLEEAVDAGMRSDQLGDRNVT